MYCISISFKTAPLEVREKFAFSREEAIEFAKLAVKKQEIRECMVLSTCNRNEVYFVGTRHAIEEMEELLSQYKKVSRSQVIKYYYIFAKEAAVRHAFAVASGMDSMVLGEDEILGQVKDAYQLALGNQTTDFVLNTVFQNAMNCAKKIKTDTNLSKTPVSIGTLVANEIFHFPKEEKNVFIVGLTGKMGTIIMKNVYGRHGVTVFGSTRTVTDHYQKEYPNVRVVGYGERYPYLEEADIVISATTSPHYTITKEELEKHLTSHKKRLYIDLAVPSDIDKSIEELGNITLYNIDYFEYLSKHNNQKKEREIELGKEIMEQELDETLKSIEFHGFLPEMKRVKALFKEQHFESLMYQLRDQENYESLSVVLDAFRRLGV
ncbi:glutamyl-tRNA reductase [[Clostridium] polysaccharolyticum]|uniref:Glutamyl-tRNA reductase n=1 Tax=[Clostridium] polysaccharolyticum TaxID=29364 RepID=A0A1I0BAN9_9FIRM|nr:glutamyl-tRNA reductase [[Clostridium] polysaccharolyticum]SET03601.1 glutamyl-tRNA reductase [[Clostridium] polysaccharolyticum]